MKEKINSRLKIIFLIVSAFGLFFLLFVISRSFLARGKEQSTSSFDFLAYDKNFRGGINVSCGDIDGNGKDEIVTSPKSGGASNIRIFDKDGKSLGFSFYAYPKGDNHGTNITLGDVDGDGKDEIMTSSEEGPLIKIFKGQKLISKFEAWKNIKIGTSIASGDIDSDGKEEIIVGGGSRGGPQIKIFNLKGKELFSFFVFHPLSRHGIDVAAFDVNRDNKSEVIASQKSGEPAMVKIYKLDEAKSIFSTFYAYPKNFKIGANIAVGDLSGDGEAEIIAAQDFGEESKIKGFKPDGIALPLNLSAFDSDFRGGADVAICNLDGVDKKEIVVGMGAGGEPRVRVFYKY
jgi:hypothetical protein